LLALINDLLDLAKIQAGRLQVKQEQVGLHDLVASAVEMMSPLAAASSIDLSFQVPGRLVVRADRRRLEQVVVNLLSNAIKFTPAGGQVRVSALTGDGLARIDVQDTGVGLEPADLERIFEDFTQVDRDSLRSQGGTGLGL